MFGMNSVEIKNYINENINRYTNNILLEVSIGKLFSNKKMLDELADWFNTLSKKDAHKKLGGESNFVKLHNQLNYFRGLSKLKNEDKIRFAKFISEDPKNYKIIFTNFFKNSSEAKRVIDLEIKKIAYELYAKQKGVRVNVTDIRNIPEDKVSEFLSNSDNLKKVNKILDDRISFREFGFTDVANSGAQNVIRQANKNAALDRLTKLSGRAAKNVNRVDIKQSKGYKSLLNNIESMRTSNEDIANSVRLLNKELGFKRLSKREVDTFVTYLKNESKRELTTGRLFNRDKAVLEKLFTTNRERYNQLLGAFLKSKSFKDAKKSFLGKATDKSSAIAFLKAFIKILRKTWFNKHLFRIVLGFKTANLMYVIADPNRNIGDYLKGHDENISNFELISKIGGGVITNILSLPYQFIMETFELFSNIVKSEAEGENIRKEDIVKYIIDKYGDNIKPSTINIIKSGALKINDDTNEVKLYYLDSNCEGGPNNYIRLLNRGHRWVSNNKDVSIKNAVNSIDVCIK